MKFLGPILPIIGFTGLGALICWASQQVGSSQPALPARQLIQIEYLGVDGANWIKTSKDGYTCSSTMYRYAFAISNMDSSKFHGTITLRLCNASGELLAVLPTRDIDIPKTSTMILKIDAEVVPWKAIGPEKLGAKRYSFSLDEFGRETLVMEGSLVQD
jgi:hypothetical protein